MPNARIIRNSLTGGIAAFAAVFAVGCGSHSTSAAGQGSSPSAAQSRAASAGAPATQDSRPAPVAPASTAAASTPSCTTSGLRITLGDGGAAAGTDFTVLDFTNSSTATCTLYGFPGVSLLNSSGAQIGAAASGNPSTAPVLVTLAPGAKANARLGVAAAGNYPAADCKPQAAARLKVFPPNQTQPVELSFAAAGCTVSSSHQLSVTAVSAGAGQTVKG